MAEVLRALAAQSLTRQQKDRLVYIYRRMGWWFKWPYRTWLRGGIERRIPAIPGRSWRTNIPPALHVSLINGAIKYTYRGVRMIKHPIDMALYLKLLWDLKPRSVIEIGSRDGGTAGWFGDMMNLWKLPGLVVSIDLHPPKRPYFCDANVRFMEGDEEHLEELQDVFEDLPHPWFFINDASHNASKTKRCLDYIHRFMEKGDYLVVEDGFLTEAGMDWEGWREGGPALAIAQFLADHSGCYEVDGKYCDYYGRNVTANANGYLRRV